MISEKYKVVLLDIEGTTSAIDFVHTTMFDYARNNLEGFLDSSFETKETIDALEVFAQNENCPTLAVFLEGTFSKSEKITRIVTLAIQRMKEDSKATGLKALQGLVWRKGFNNGELKGHIYEDVPTAFHRWKSSKLTIAIYSSGSILAQKNLLCEYYCRKSWNADNPSFRYNLRPKKNFFKLRKHRQQPLCRCF